MPRRGGCALNRRWRLGQPRRAERFNVALEGPRNVNGAARPSRAAPCSSPMDESFSAAQGSVRPPGKPPPPKIVPGRVNSRRCWTSGSPRRGTPPRGSQWSSSTTPPRIIAPRIPGEDSTTVARNSARRPDTMPQARATVAPWEVRQPTAFPTAPARTPSPEPAERSILIDAASTARADALTVGCSLRMTFGPCGARFGLSARRLMALRSHFVGVDLQGLRLRRQLEIPFQIIAHRVC